jgi:LPXTG-motif cell wall-anchored protein
VIRLPRAVRRPLAVAAAAFVGLAAALAISTPASAHTVTVKGEADCVSGKWVVTWTATSSNTDLTGTFDKAEYLPANPGAEHIREGAELPAGGQLTETQVVAGSEGSASLSVHMTWPNNHESADKASITFEGKCKDEGQPAAPSASFASNCDGSVDVNLQNPTDADVTFTVNGEDADVAAGGSQVVTVGADEAETITVTWGKDGSAKGGFEQPDNCPTISGLSDCDTLSFEVENFPGNPVFVATFTPSTGEAKTLQVAAGEKKSVSFAASEGFSVKVTGFDKTEVVTWEQPDNCGGLPKTGANTGAIASGGAALLAGGGILFFFVRRRRIRFTAA